jgi:uridine kinase
MELSIQDQLLIDQISQALGPWHKYLIAIDGRDGSGKSRLARFLAFKLDMPMIETDLFLIPHQGEPIYRYDELKNAIDTRHQLDRPVIVEGILILDLLDHIALKQDYLVYVSNPGYEGSYSLSSRFHEYEAYFSPQEAVDFMYVVEESS